jgi:NAD-dependent DNA ligase
MNPYARYHVAVANELKGSCAVLLGIAQGLLSDGQLQDSEIQFLRDWLTANEAMSASWPGDVLLAQVEEVLRDGCITEAEREHLISTLQELVGGRLENLADSPLVTQLAMDEGEDIRFDGRLFCLTGDFVFGPRSTCEEAIVRRGGEVKSGISKKIDFVVVGGLGSKEWKHGGFGTKVERAVELQREGAKLRIVHEDAWAEALRGAKTAV